MINRVQRFWDWDAARGWQLIWLSMLLVLMKLVAGFVAVDYTLTPPFESVPPPSYMVL